MHSTPGYLDSLLEVLAQYNQTSTNQAGEKFKVQRAYLITEIQFGFKHKLFSNAREK